MVDTVRKLTATETLDPANSFVTNSEILAYLNAELAELYDVIIESHDEDFMRNAANIALTSGTSVYPLPVDFYKIISVDIRWSPTIVRPARKFTEAERDRFKSVLPLWSYLTDIYYRTLGDNIEFQPAPQAGITAICNYIPAFVPLASLTDTFNSQNQWHWFAIWGAVAMVRQKDEDKPGAALALQKREQVRARIHTHAASRNDGEPPRVQDVRSQVWDD